MGVRLNPNKQKRLGVRVDGNRLGIEKQLFDIPVCTNSSKFSGTKSTWIIFLIFYEVVIFALGAWEKGRAAREAPKKDTNTKK